MTQRHTPSRKLSRKAVARLNKSGVKGCSLVELCVCLAITAVLLSQAIPALNQLVQRQRLQLIAQALMTDLQQARSEAVQRSDAIHMRFSQHPTGSCYVMHSGVAGQCVCSDQGQAVCQPTSTLIKQVWVPASQQISLNANFNNMSFQARQGAVTSTGSVEIALDHGPALRHVISIAGRVRTCTPNGGMSQFPRC
jgi:type IV fimbrial biogenesis protein FimT